MQKNTVGKWIVFAFEDEGGTNPGEPVTGDAANITANVRIDGAAANAVDDTNPTELEDGYYIFDITAAENNGDLILIAPASATANVNVIGVPGAVYTTPANFNDLSITATTGRTDVAAVGGTTQTANDNGADINAILADSNELQADWANGGRLDLILDIIAADTTTDIPALIATAQADLDTLEARLTAARAGYLDALNGHTAQTGDSYARLGAPAGASISADIAVIEGRLTAARAGYLDALSGHVAQTGDNYARLGAPAGASIAADLAAIDQNVDDLESGIILGACQTGTLSTTQCTTDLTGYTDDQLVRGEIIFLSGPCEGERAQITGYANTNGLITHAATQETPANGNTFKIV